jgi:hypothetical protein
VPGGYSKLIDDYTQVYKRLHQEMIDLKIERERHPMTNIAGNHEDGRCEHSTVKRESGAKK